MTLRNILLFFGGFVVLYIVMIWAMRKCESPERKLIRRIKSHLDTYVLRLHLEHPTDNRVTRLHQRYQVTKVFESDNHETFTLNKGEQIVICLRNYAKQQKIHDDFNLLIFVGLHELAHIMSTSVDHTDEFWKNFKFILRSASEMNMYDPIDYALDPVEYCAMIVHDNPYFYERTVQEFMSQIQHIVLGE